jgi:hypothetical protein
VSFQRDVEPTVRHHHRPSAHRLGHAERGAASPAGTLLHLQRLAGNAAVSATMLQRATTGRTPAELTRIQRQVTISRNHDDADAVTPDSIRAALAAVNVVDTTSTEMLLRPQEMFALVPANVPAKAAAYNAVQSAVKRLRAAEKAVAAATATQKARKIAAATRKFEAAQTALEASVVKVKAYILKTLESHDASMTGLTRAEKTTKTKLAELSKAPATRRSADQQAAHDTKVADLTAALEKTRADIAARHEALSDQVEAGTYGPQSTDRHYYSITVDGETVKMYDHVEAYATTAADGVEGKATGETKHDVADVLDASGLSDSRKKILKVISAAEGGFTTVNTWDRATLTWGFVQWTGGDHSDLTAAMAIIKRVAPDAFNQRFAKYGIDVDNGKLVVTGGDGAQKKGDAAATAVQGSPLLTAIMSRAGMDPEIQKAQVKAADEYEIQRPLDQHLSITFRPPGAATGPKTTASIRLGDVITSEYAVGVIADQTVHGGMGSFLKAVKKALQKFVDTNHVDAADVATWAGDAEPHLLAVMIQWASRAKAMEKAGASKAAHSFS